MSNENAQPTANRRLHGLDALRAVAMMLGVWLHAGMPYIKGLPPFFWAIDDPDKSETIGLSISFVHSWRMETFFLLSGFFTAMLVARRGLLSTARQRTLRIALPFVAAVIVIQPMCAALWGMGYSAQWGWPIGNTVPMMLKTSWNIPVDGSPHELVRLWHLWFLYELIWFVAAGLLVCSVAPGWLRRFANAFGGALGYIVGSWWGAAVLAIPVAAALLMHSPSGASPNTTLVPNWSSMAYYALPFFCGWLIYPARHQLDRLARWWWCPMAMGLLIAFPLFIGASREGALGWDPPVGAYRVGIAAHALMTTGFGFGMIGLFLRLLASPGPRVERIVRYVSDMAYWVYLAHMPIVVGLGILLVDWRAPALLKMGVVLAGSGLVLLLSYQFMVRYTVIGRLLNGPRGRRGDDSG
ncbi:MAG: acyltransferase family protein [Phycisphaerales bacterium]